MSMFSSISSRLAGRASDGEPEGASEPEGSSPGESRSELLYRIQELTERNERLTLRFRDVVGAYKATLKEKEALEASVAALTGNGGDDNEEGEADNSEDRAQDTQDEKGGDDAGAKPAEEGKPASTKSGESGGNSGASATKLKQQLDALGRAMATLTKEKTTMETRFQADKKVVADAHRNEIEQLKNDHRSRIAQLEATVSELKEECDAKSVRVDQLTEQLRSGHEADTKRTKEWERTRKQHQKELEEARRQGGSGSDASARILDLESRLQKAQDAELEALTQLSTGTAELKDKIASLEDEVDAANKRALSAGSKGDGKLVLALKREIAALEKRCADFQQQAADAKAELGEAVRTAQEKMAAADDKVSLCMNTSDERAQEILQQRVMQENRISELSDMVGRYEAARLEDSARIAELQAECEELREVVREADNNASEQTPGTSSDPDRSIRALEGTVEKLQDLLRAANDRIAELESADVPLSPTPADRSDSGSSRGGVLDDLQRSRQVERDLRAQLKQALQDKVAEVQAERKKWQTRIEAEEAAASERIETLEATHRRVVEEMSAKSARARERTLQLIDDRNDEVRRLRKLLGDAAPTDPLVGSAAGGGVLATDGEGGAAESAENGGAFVLGKRRDSGQLVHSVLEEQEKGKEAAAMRREIRELQGSVLDANEKSNLLEEQSRKLKEEIRRLERNKLREGANLEYLKNVLVKFMCKEIGQEQMLLAIATILQFSPAELKDVKNKLAAQSSTWWAGRT
eukprot:m.22489 g.22489  ORF g.22489 m.22489 type:complete len:756 (+) comp3993_c0_seq1:71-2338(+)